MPTDIPTDKQIAGKTVELITADLSRVYSLEELASLAGVTAFTLRRIFKAQYGVGLGRFSRIARIEKAKELLSGTNNTLQMIAEAVGYTEASNFQSAFRSIVGCTAGEWRKKSQLE